MSTLIIIKKEKKQSSKEWNPKRTKGGSANAGLAASVGGQCKTCGIRKHKSDQKQQGTKWSIS